MNSESDDDVRKGNKVLRCLQIAVFLYGILNLLIRGAELLLAIIATSVIVAAFVTGIRNPNTFQDYLNQEAKHAIWRGPFNNLLTNTPHNIPDLKSDPIGVGNVASSIPVGVGNVITPAPLVAEDVAIFARLGAGNESISGPLVVGNVTTPAPLVVGNVTVPAALEVGNVTTPASLGVGNITTPAPLEVGNVTTPAPLEVGNVTTPAPLGIGNVTTPTPLKVGGVTTSVPLGVQNGTIPVGKIPSLDPFDDKMNLHIWSSYFLMKCIIFVFGWLLVSSAKRFSFCGNLVWVAFSIPILAEYILQIILDLSLGDYFERELPSQIWQGVDVGFQLLGVVLVSTFLHQLYQMDDRIQGIDRYNGFPSRNGDISITEIVDDDRRYK